MMMHDYEKPETVNNFDKFKLSSMTTTYIDKPSFKALVGDVSNKTVIDYGCGTGQYTRIFAEKAKQVIGVDIASKMIELALKEDNKNNIKYYLKDCLEILDLDQHDVVVSTYFLCHASNSQILKKMVKSMFESLKPGGFCYAITRNANLRPDEFHFLRKYNLEYEAPKGFSNEGDAMIVRFLDSDTKKPLFETIDYCMPPSIVEETFKEIGFINFKWVPLSLKEESKEYAEFLADYFQHPGDVMLSAQKP